jgi:hypothetical protein
MVERTASTQEWFDTRLREGPSRIHGIGVFASYRIAEGDVVMRWGGVVIDAMDYDPALHRPSATTRYDESRLLTRFVGSERRFDESLNHSCDPNAWMLGEATLVARRAIEAGEEVTTDCAMWSDDDYVYTTRCLCGSSFCRRTITGLDWRLRDLRDRYRGHFLPCIERACRALEQDGR